jgi:hypothetical protein
MMMMMMMMMIVIMSRRRRKGSRKGRDERQLITQKFASTEGLTGEGTFVQGYGECPRRRRRRRAGREPDVRRGEDDRSRGVVLRGKGRNK